MIGLRLSPKTSTQKLIQIGHQLVLTSKETLDERGEGEELKVGEEGWCGVVFLSLLTRMDRLAGGKREEFGVLCELGREFVRTTPLSLLISLDKRTLDWLGKELKRGKKEERDVTEKLTQISIYSMLLGVDGARGLCFSIFRFVSENFLVSLFEGLDGGEEEEEVALLVAFCLFFHWKVIEGEVSGKRRDREGRGLLLRGWEEAEEARKAGEILRRCFEGRGDLCARAKRMVEQRGLN